MPEANGSERLDRIEAILQNMAERQDKFFTTVKADPKGRNGTGDYATKATGRIYYLNWVTTFNPGEDWKAVKQGETVAQDPA